MSFRDLTAIIFAATLWPMIAWTPARVTSLVSAFGGNVKMAKAIGHRRHTTIQQWLARGKIPGWRYREIEEGAAKAGVTLPRWFRNGGPS